jgi:hypothetical protein
VGGSDLVDDVGRFRIGQGQYVEHTVRLIDGGGQRAQPDAWAQSFE